MEVTRKYNVEFPEQNVEELLTDLKNIGGPGVNLGSLLDACTRMADRGDHEGTAVLYRFGYDDKDEYMWVTNEDIWIPEEGHAIICVWFTVTEAVTDYEL